MRNFADYARAQLDRLDWAMNDWACHLPEPGQPVTDFQLVDLVNMGVEIDDLVCEILQGIVVNGTLLGSGMQWRFREVACKQCRLNELLVSLAARVENWCAADCPPVVH